MTGLTAEQTAVAVGHQLWFSEQLAAALANADRVQGQQRGRRSWEPGAARRIGEHIELWRRQLPESVLLEPDTRPRPAPGHQAVVHAVADAGDESSWRHSIDTALATAMASLDEVIAEAGPIADGALLRAARLVRDDLGALRSALPPH